jgi:hypothetical protein
MSLLAGLLRAALPVGSGRRDRILGAARKAGVLPAPPESSYQRWQQHIEADAAASAAAPATPHELRLAAESVRFDVIIDADGRTDPGSVTRTLVSLSNQTFSNWTAHLPSSDSAGLSRQATSRLLVDAQIADPRVISTPAVPSDQPDSKTSFEVHLRFGDALSATALTELAVLAVRHPDAHMLSGEFDMIDPFSGRRSAPAAIGSWEPDLAQQFDLSAGFVAIRSAQNSAGESAKGAFVPHATNVLLHRLVGPKERVNALVPPAPHLGNAAAQRSPHRNGGLRVHHQPLPFTTAAIVVRDPLSAPLLAAQHSQALVDQAGASVTVANVTEWTTGTPFPLLSENVDVVVIVDGGLVPAEKGWLDDLTGALQQPHVFAVAPVLQVPSGIVFDAGVMSDGTTLRARSGRLDLAPYELARCRQVPTLTGRAVVIRAQDLGHSGLAAALTAGQFSRALGDAAAGSQRCCLVWAHQRWTLASGLDAKSTDSPMLAWTRGRLRNWWEPSVEAHQPEPGRQGEGVW